MAESFNHNVEGEWGWEPLGSEDDGCENSDICTAKSEEYIVQLNDRTESSDKLDKLAAGKRIGKAFSGNNIKGIIASPSFQELEKAIGATIAMSFSGDVVDAESKSLSPGQNISSRNSSSTNLTQQKVIQQRMRQQQFHQKNNSNHHLIKSPLTNSAEVFDATRRELMLFLNEPESRALIILHSSAVSPSDLRSACSKFGVLYYIRPEFHAKGVTFISYFDLHAAMEAKENLTSLFPRDQDVSAHYSIMLHATNSNTEEFKLVVKNLPNDGVDSDVQSIFSRYGSLRCIQKTFGSTDFKSPSQSTSYCVEYFDIQDARLAASELSATSTNVWGPDVIVKFAPLDDSKVHLCRQLLGTLSRWRNEATPSTQSIPPYKQNLYYSNDQKSMPQVAMGTFNAYNAPIDPYAYDNLLKQHAFSTQIHSFNFPYHSFVPNANFIAPFPQQINPAYEPTYIPGPQLSGNHYIKPNGMVPVQFFAANEHEIDRYSQHTNNPSDLNGKKHDFIRLSACS